MVGWSAAARKTCWNSFIRFADVPTGGIERGYDSFVSRVIEMLLMQ